MTVSTTSRWWCMAEGCDEQGEGDTSYRQATKHVKDTEPNGPPWHSTSTSSGPTSTSREKK